MAPTPQANVVSLKKELSSAVTAARVEDIIAILTQLKKDVVVSEELIRVTKIGITVNSLRKNENKAVSELAKEIIKKWKSDVGAAKPAKATAESATPSLVLPTPSPGPNSPSLTRKPEPTPPSEPPTPVASSSTTPAPLRPAAAGRRFSLNGATRTHKTDAVTFNEPSFLGDKTRSKCLELLYDALALDSDAPTELIYKQAKAVELHVHEANDTAAYRVKIRSLFQNLKDKSNPSLRENVVSGEISATKLCTMTPAEMASEELQAENRKLVELNLFKAQGAAPQQAETDAFQCGKCKQRRTMYYQMQTRSADEPMTTFVTCLECNNRFASFASFPRPFTPFTTLPPAYDSVPPLELHSSAPLRTRSSPHLPGLLQLSADPPINTFVASPASRNAPLSAYVPTEQEASQFYDSRNYRLHSFSSSLPPSIASRSSGSISGVRTERRGGGTDLVHRVLVEESSPTSPRTHSQNGLSRRASFPNLRGDAVRMTTRLRNVASTNGNAQPEIDPATLPPTLPTARAPPLNLPQDRLWSLLFLFLQSLSVLPSLAGFAYSVHRFSTVTPLLFATQTWAAGGRSHGTAEGKSTRLDWFLSGMWALACAYFSHSLAKGILKRWLVYYSLLPTVIRVISLQAICWPLTLTTHRFLSFDQPVAAWLVCATTAAFSNIIQIWVTSNIATVEKKHRRGNRWRMLSIVVAAVLGPGVRTEKFRKSEKAKFSWKRVLVGTVIPFAILGWITTTALLWQQFSGRYHGGGGIHASNFGGMNYRSTNSTRQLLPGLDTTAEIRIVMLVTSSWTDRSIENRQNFRRSTVKLIPSSPPISIVYKFLLGTAPSPQTQAKKAAALVAEEAEHGDLLMLDSLDNYESLSRKIYEGWKWAAEIGEVDYVLKTDDDMFLRMDIIGKELVDLGRRNEYWKGFAYWAIPAIQDSSNKNADFAYELSSFPPYTAGALHILSHDLVALIAPPRSSPSISSRKLFVKNEDQNLGLWLYPSGIRPIHDHRIQQGQICEADMIAKHFGGQYKEENGIGPVEMYDNLMAGRELCAGFVRSWCGVCYPSCWGKENHWRDWGFSCDTIKGATLTSSLKSSSSDSPTISTLGSRPIKSPPSTLIMGSTEDPWIIPGVLSHQSSAFAGTDDYHLLHMLCWTTAIDTFQERHYQAIETIWIHEPRAVLIIFVTMLPDNFFKVYTDAGYAIHVVKVGGQELLERGWYLGENSKGWLEDWAKWEQGPYFFSHLTDYLRYLFLFKFGGTYLDMDAPWIRAPPSTSIEGIGGDYSTVASDLSWTLDETGLYLAPGVMRFRAGWNLFQDISERFFDSKTYLIGCFNCVGPRAITIYVRERRRELESAGFTILPRQVFYTYGWEDSHRLIERLPGGPQHAMEELRRIEKESWSVHLFGKMTNHLLVHPDSITGIIFDRYSLKLPRAAGRLSSNIEHGMGNPMDLGKGLELVGPLGGEYIYRDRLEVILGEREDMRIAGSIDGRFDGLNSIFIRGTKNGRVKKAVVEFTLSSSNSTTGGSISFSAASTIASSRLLTAGGFAGGREIRFELVDASLKDVNALLNSMRYLVGKQEKGEKETMRIRVQYGTEKAELTFEIVL